MVNYKDNLSPYHIYYGKLAIMDHSYVLDDFTLQHAQTEYSLEAVQKLMHIVGLRSPSIKIQFKLFYQW